jgi:succinate dehydrogenase assembly factor 1
LKTYWNDDDDKPLTPCKIVILVNDLDRCQPEKVVEVIEALALLTEDTPFVVFLAGNSSGLSSAIEIENGKYFSNTGQSGYSFLNTMIHLPFVVPAVTLAEKE